MAETLVDAIEESLGDRLSDTGVARLPNDPKLLAKLSRDIRAHYGRFALPEKERSHLRPFPSTRFTPGSDLSLAHYVAAANAGAWNGSDALPITQQLKRYLLYCHSVVFLDPLLHILDYFHAGQLPEGDYFLRLKGLLREYAELRELIVNRVIVPVSDAQYQILEMRAVSRRLAELGYDPADLDSREGPMNWILVQVMMELEKLGNRADLFFPNRRWVTIYKSFLKEQERRFSSADLIEPIKVGMLGELTSINPRGVGVRDMIAMRRNEPLFEKYRAALGKALGELYAGDGDYSDLNTEFERRSSAMFRELEEEAETLRRKSSLTALLFDPSQAIAIGAAGAAFGALVLGGAGMAAAAAGSVAGALFPTMITIAGAYAGRQDAAAFRRHFMVLKG